MESNSDHSQHKLSEFHACIHCGSIFRRDEFHGTPVATGIYPCSKCGLDGPLNIVIQDVDAAATGKDHSSPRNSGG